MKKKTNFFTDLLTYQNRLVVLASLFGVGAIIVEWLVAEIGQHYMTRWPAIVSFFVLSLLFIGLIKVKNLTKKQLAWCGTVLSVLGVWFLLYRIIENQFNPLLQVQLLGAFGLMFFVFERSTFFLFFGISSILGMVPVITELHLKEQDHLLFVGLFVIGAMLYIIGFIVNINRIKLLVFSEGVLSTYDRYIIVFDEFAEVVYVNPYTLKVFGLDPQKVQQMDWWRLRRIPEKEAREYKQLIIDRIKENKPIPLYTQVIVNANGERRIIEWNAQIVGGKYHVGHGTDVTDELNALDLLHLSGR